MITIIGDGNFPEARAFDDVATALQDIEHDIYLAAMLAKPLGLSLKSKIIYNLEPLYDGCRSFSIGYLDTLRDNTVLDYDRRNVAYLARLDIEALHLPYGYHAALTRPVSALKDIDVLFVGSVNARRQQLLSPLQGLCNFVWAQGVYGRDLDQLIARAKVHINVHFCEKHPLEVVRLNYLMANDCTIVSERGWDGEQVAAYAPGIIFADNIAAACLEALEQPKPSYHCITQMPHDNAAARAWLNRSL